MALIDQKRSMHLFLPLHSLLKTKQNSPYFRAAEHDAHAETILFMPRNHLKTFLNMVFILKLISLGLNLKF